MRISFKSLNIVNTYYLIDGKMAWDRTDRRLSAVEWARWYDTMGDGSIQHAPDEPVQKIQLGDFCASLTQYLLDNPSDTEAVAKRYRYSDVYRPEIEFYKSLIHKEKIQFYNPRDRKISTAESKRHDKRWFTVPEWAKGSLESVWKFQYEHGPSYDLLTCCVTLTHIAEILDCNLSLVEFFDLPPNSAWGINSLITYMNAYKQQEWAKVRLETYCKKIAEQNKQAA